MTNFNKEDCLDSSGRALKVNDLVDFLCFGTQRIGVYIGKYSHYSGVYMVLSEESGILESYGSISVYKIYNPLFLFNDKRVVDSFMLSESLKENAKCSVQ